MINKEDLENFYTNHSTKETCIFFNVSKKELIEILDGYNIQPHTKQENISFTLLNKTEEQKNQTELRRKRTNQLRYGCDNVSQVKEISDRISNTRKNFTEEQRQHQIDSFRTTINSRSEEEKEIVKLHKSNATKNYFKNLTEDQKKSFSNKMSEVYKNLPDDVKELRKLKIKETYKKTCLDKYGISNTSKLNSVKQKIIQTNLERYNVPYYCQTERCRSALGGNSSLSKPNLLFQEYLINNNIIFSTEFSIDTFSYDFKVDNILIEINPWITHNSTFSPFGNPKEKDYHFKKSNIAKENNYRCIHVWDWDDIDKILFLLKNQEIIYARKCEIREIDLDTSHKFLNQFHMQGYIRSDIQIGLYFDKELISIMTFGKPRYNKHYQYELLRYATIKKVVGGSTKMFKYFLNKYSPISIISYCDYSKFNGNIYEKLGFNYDGVSIGKHWYNPYTKKHITDNLLRQRGYDQLFGTNYGKGSNNEELMLKNGFVEIYDAGQGKYIFKNE